MIAQDSEDLTRVGPGTVMGGFLRQYWLPFARSSELEPDGAPMRTVLLGERLIAFRDSSGRVGVMDHRCPHRCASLFLGRNEEDGIRCIYHGWKFDVTGACVDMPSVPAHQDFRDKVRAKAYPAAERNGLVWAYMGERAVPPPLPAIEPNLLAREDVSISFVQRDCNFVQALEGDIDTSHFGFLHAGGVDPEMLPDGHPIALALRNRAPQYQVADAPWGTYYGAFRPAEVPGRRYWRVAHFLFPCWTQQPQGDLADHVHARAWVPMDDTHTMFINIAWTGAKRSGDFPPGKDGPLPGLKLLSQDHYLPNTTDWFGRWRRVETAANDWLIDRAAQRDGGSYTGLTDVHMQDQAVTESMGPITDHAGEHLAPSDMMVARTRRRLLQAARAFRDTGVAPGVDDPDLFLGARSGFFVADESSDWQQAFADEVAAAARPASRVRAAE